MVSNNICGGRALGIAVGITALAILLLAGSASALSNSGGGSWSYNKDIIITNTGNALTEYQVQVNLDGNNFPTNARSDGADIRFTDAGGNELSYWIESWDYAGRSAKIWVKVPNIAGGGSATIRMYYGNTMAVSVSNGGATFMFYDDFSGDLNKWDVANAIGTWTIESGEVSGTMSGITEASLFANGLSIENGVVEYKYRYLLDNTAAGIQVRSSSNVARSNYNVMFFDHPELNVNYLQSYENGAMSENKVDFNSAVNTYYNAKLEFNGVSIKGTLDTVLNQRILDWSQAGTFGLILLYGIANGHQHWDDIRVRKYASPEPSVSVGAEVSGVVEIFKIAHITDVHVGYYLDSSGMNESVTRFTDTLQAVKSANPDRLLITGDLVEYDDRDFFMAFKNIMRGISIPYNTTPGNHDRRGRLTDLTADNLLDYNNIINHINTPSNPNENNYFFDYKGYRFIGLDSGADFNATEGEYALGLLNKDRGPESNGLSDEQLSRLMDKEKLNNSAPKIIFMHHPAISSQDDYFDEYLQPNAVPNDGGPGGNDNTIAFNRWNFINYSRDSNVQLVLTGHSHNDAIFNLGGDSVENISLNRPLFIQTRSATKDENGGPGYRIIEVKDGKANPYNSAPIPRFERNSSALTLKNIYLAQLGLHAYDSLKRHTGMISCSDDFELGIPDSYYTGNYGGSSSTPEVIVGYSNDTVIGTEITQFKVASPCRTFASNAVKSVSSSQPSSENISFNQTIEKQNDRFTTEINFYGVNITTSSTATVNISNIIYKMEIDLNGDGTTDKTINPDSIDTILAQPQKNIDVITYNGAGTINLITGSGNFIKASSLNPLLLTGKPPYEFPYGVFGFNISGLNRGQTVEITITLPRNISSAALYWKYGSTPDTPLPHWYQIPLGSNDGDNVITIQLQDGGVGDDDLTANGIILDAGGPAIPIAGKVTGEGWIVSPITPAPKNNNKATFEFVASYVKGEPKGSIEYTDHAAGVKIHGTVTTLSVDKEANTAAFSGLAEINGAKYAYTVTAVDNGEPGKTDTFSINIPAINYMASGTLGGGNIQIHKDKIEDKDEVERD